MGAYAVGVTTPLIHFLSEFIFINKCRSKEVAFADDYTAAEKASEINHIGYTTTTRAFLWLLPQTTQIVVDCESAAL